MFLPAQSLVPLIVAYHSFDAIALLKLLFTLTFEGGVDCPYGISSNDEIRNCGVG